MQVSFLCAVFSSSVKWPVDDTRVSDVFCWIQAKAQYYNPTLTLQPRYYERFVVSVPQEQMIHRMRREHGSVPEVVSTT